MGGRFTIFCFVLLCIRGEIPITSPREAYIRRDDLTEGFLRYDFGGLIFGGAYTWRGLFSEFYGMSFRSVKRPKRAYKRVLWSWKSREKFMFLSFIHIWNILYLQQLKGVQSLDRASPYKTLLSTQPPHLGLPILGDPRTVSWIWRKCLVESLIAQRINVLSDFFKVVTYLYFIALWICRLLKYGGVTAFWASPRFGHPHSQIPSVLGIPFSYYCSVLGIPWYPPGMPKSLVFWSSPPKKMLDFAGKSKTFKRWLPLNIEFPVS